MSGSLKATVLADLPSEINEVREKDEMGSTDKEFEEKFIPDILPTQTQSTVDDIEIKHEDVDYHNNNGSSNCESDDKLEKVVNQIYFGPDFSTREPDSDGNCDLKNITSIPHVDGAESDDPGEKDMNNFYPDLHLCDRDCETCVKYLRMLSEHVRATHTPPQPIHDPLLIDPVNIDHEQSSSIVIKCEVDEATQKMECSQEASESNIPLSAHKEFESECESENEIDPEYTPPAYLTRSAPRRGLTKNKVSSDSKITKVKKGTLSSRKEFKCDVCHKRFSDKGHLNAHKLIHTQQKPYKCRECEKSFTISDYLTRHMLVHTGEKLYSCGKCEKSFSRSDHLTRHMTSHTGEKPYECSVCEKSYSSSYHLTAHMKSHTGEKPYECSVCEKSYSSSYQLSTHKRTHAGAKPFKCAVCEQSFSTSYHLTTHVRIHTGEKPYECTVCMKSFRRSDHLTKHKSIHTGDKPYECDQCQSYFTTSSHLTEHKKIHIRTKVFK